MKASAITGIILSVYTGRKLVKANDAVTRKYSYRRRKNNPEI